MELCFLKGNALDTLKASLPQTYEKYFVERDNLWLAEICGENPFMKFRDVPDFELVPIEPGSDVSEIDFRNSKLLYKNLHFLTPRQAADERFWAGLCHGVFYDYVRRRWSYDDTNKTNFSTTDDDDDDEIKKLADNEKKEINRIKNRFFFNGGARERITKNTLSKYWWMGHIFSNDGLDILGAKNFYTKIFSIVSRSFIGNKILCNGFVKFLKHFKTRGITLEIKKHIRPAMSELNKRGGAVILDCLTEEEIAAIMIEYVEKIFAVKQSVESTKVVTPIPKSHFATEKPAVNHGDTQTVKHNSRIKLVPIDGGGHRTRILSDELKNNSANIYNELLGKKLNSVVTIKGKRFKITEIKQARSLKNF